MRVRSSQQNGYADQAQSWAPTPAPKSSFHFHSSRRNSPVFAPSNAFTFGSAASSHSNSSHSSSSLDRDASVFYPAETPPSHPRTLALHDRDLPRISLPASAQPISGNSSGAGRSSHSFVFTERDINHSNSGNRSNGASAFSPLPPSSATRRVHRNSFSRTANGGTIAHSLSLDSAVSDFTQSADDDEHKHPHHYQQHAHTLHAHPMHAPYSPSLHSHSGQVSPSSHAHTVCGTITAQGTVRCLACGLEHVCVRRVGNAIYSLLTVVFSVLLSVLFSFRITAETAQAVAAHSVRAAALS